MLILIKPEYSIQKFLIVYTEIANIYWKIRIDRIYLHKIYILATIYFLTFFKMNKHMRATYLIKCLEKETGKPIQLRAETPESIASNSRAEILGSLRERKIKVKRTDKIELRYLKDIEFLEGNYENIAELEKKVRDHTEIHAMKKANHKPNTYMLHNDLDVNADGVYTPSKRSGSSKKVANLFYELFH